MYPLLRSQTLFINTGGNDISVGNDTIVGADWEAERKACSLLESCRAFSP